MEPALCDDDQQIKTEKSQNDKSFDNSCSLTTGNSTEDLLIDKYINQENNSLPTSPADEGIDLESELHDDSNVDDGIKVVVSSMALRLKRIETLIVLSCFVALAFNHLKSSTDLNLTRTSRQPSALFPNASFLEVYDGDYTRVYFELLKHEVSVTFHYAPWDATSRKQLAILDELAKQMPDVRFIAINCWQSLLCAKLYDFKSYPSARVFVRDLESIQYMNYAFTKEYFATFLYNIINPLTIINDYSDWYSLRAKHTAVVTIPIEYFQFGYILALEALRRDPQQLVGFAITRNAGPMIRLHLWNSNFAYDESDNLTVIAVARWIYSRVTEPLTQLRTVNSKSAQFRNAINGTQAFAIVESRPSSRLNLQLHLLAVQLFSCKENFSDQTRDMLLSLFLRLEAKATNCDKPPPVIECTSSSNECSKQMINVTYRRNWDSYVTQKCTESEISRLRRIDFERFCQTHWILPDKEPFVDGSSLFGLACGKKNQFRIIIVDSTQSDSLETAEAPVVLYDMLREVKYLLPQSQFTARGIEVFFHQALTNSVENLRESTNLVRKDIYHRKPDKFVPPHRRPEETLSDTVVLFYTNWCGFCKSVMSIYIRVAHFFKTAPISFRRVDGEGSRFEDIRYTPDSYPQIVFFPKNTSDSFRYRGAWKTQGLTRFILEHCSEEVLRKF